MGCGCHKKNKQARTNFMSPVPKNKSKSYAQTVKELAKKKK